MRKAIFGALSAAVVIAGCTTSAEQYEVLQTAFEGSPRLRQMALDDCVSRQKKQSARQLKFLAALANTSVEAAPRVACTRLVNAVANGRMSASDLQSIQLRRPTPKIVKIIQGRV